MTDTELLRAALAYADLKWFVFPLHPIRPDGKCSCNKPDCPSPGKHPRIKWSTGATCDPAEVRRLWTRFPDSGIGCATGPSGLIVFDLDGPKGLETFQRLMTGSAPANAPVARTARGAHVFFAGDAPTSSDPETKLDVRSRGGYVVLNPSPHASGVTYQWTVPPSADLMPPPCPAPLLAYATAKKKRPGRDGARAPSEVVNEQGGSVGSLRNPVTLPDYLLASIRADEGKPELAARVLAGLEAPDWGEVAAALACIPPDCKMDEWIRVGMALHQASKGSLQGLDIWDKWSSGGGDKYRGRGETEYKWSTFKQVPDGVGIGTLFALALQRGYKRGEVMPSASGNGGSNVQTDSLRNSSHETRPPEQLGKLRDAPGAVDSKEETAGEEHHANGHAHSDQSAFFSQFNSTPTNPLIKLNQEFAVIEDIGGKCRVMSWIPSPLDKGVRVPSFQDFRSFSERFGHKYITVKKTKHLKDGDVDFEEDVQLGGHWLKWTGRRTYRHLELAPNQPAELDNGNYNLWQGWGVMPARGRWDRMRDHIETVLAGGDATAADYILKWSAWAVQNPGLPAKVALVLRGGKGAGKGAFLSAMRTLFGAHGLQIYNRAHLVGSFNAHLRNCLFLFADEAFWAGDKQGESVLKGLITEHVVVIEQKGVDGIAWPNRLKVAMAANNAWVVPASADERRYAVFDVSDSRKQDHAYFDALHEEMRAGGLEAMLWDLLTMNVGAWSPRLVPQTKALQDQKDLSMSPLMEWWYGLLTGEGELRFEQHPKEWPAHQLLQEVTECAPWARTSARGLANFMRERGAGQRHTMAGTVWTFPAIGEARAAFEKQFGPRAWKIGVQEWGGG